MLCLNDRIGFFTFGDTVLKMLLLIAVVWFSCIVFLYHHNLGSKRTLSCGLPLMIMLATSFEYIGGFAYAIPGYDHLREGGSLYLAGYNFTKETVQRGLTVAFSGVIAFTCGAFLVAKMSTATPAQPANIPFSKNAFNVILGIGLTGIALTQVKLPIPMLGALQQVGQLTFICAIAFGLLMAMRGIRGRISLWVGLSIALPFYYLFMTGFMSYGFQAFIIISVFFMAVIMKRSPSTVKFIPALIVVLYALVSLLVVWLSFRTELRAVLWSDAGFIERFDALWLAFSKSTLLNPFNFESVDHVVTRANHGLWVGKVIEYHELHPELRLHGSGLLLSLVAWVPRFIWPGKPEAGGTLMLETHAGHEFSSNVTFGAGQVIDFYVNFGWAGVIIGFFLMGLLVGFIDRYAARALKSGNLIIAAKFFVLGLCLTRSLSEVFFLMSSGVFALAIFSAVQLAAPKLVAVRRRKRRSVPISEHWRSGHGRRVGR